MTYQNKKISINTKYLNNIITKENLMDIYQILSQGQRECSFSLNVWNCLEIHNIQHRKLNKVQNGELAANSSNHKI